MSRQYPFEPPELDQFPGKRSGRSANPRSGFALRSAQTVAGWLLALIEWRQRRQDLSRFLIAILFLLGGLGLGTTAALMDNYLHRGVESGAEQPYVVQPTGKELATNIDLRLFPESEIDSVAQELSQSGFRYVRQEFSWQQLEPTQGDFQWGTYDPLVQTLTRHNVQIIAVVKNAPSWATAGDLIQAMDRPPTDPATLEAFTRALTQHYGTNIPFIQIWDRPNLASQWGGTPATGDSFLPYLGAAYNGARAGNAEVRIITPELAMVPDQPSGQTDLEFLRSLLNANGSPFIDIVGISLDGGTLSPDDRRVDADRRNISRAILFRDVLVRSGDASTPIWATSYGWSATGDVTRERQADYVVRGMERSWSEWPWMGLMVQWAFIDPDPQSPDATYAIVLPDGYGTPMYARLTSPAVQERAGIANTGFAPMDSAAMSYEGNWHDQHLEGRTFRTTSESKSSATLTFRGTGLIAYIRTGPQAGNIRLELDGNVIPGGAGKDGDEWSFEDYLGTNDFPHTLLSGLDDTQHTVVISLVGDGELTIGGLEVVRSAPFLWPVMLITVGSLLLLFFAVRSLIYLVAIRAGHLRRRTGMDLWPQLPQMPDWRPGRRT